MRQKGNPKGGAPAAKERVSQGGGVGCMKCCQWPAVRMESWPQDLARLEASGILGKNRLGRAGVGMRNPKLGDFKVKEGECKQRFGVHL